MREIVTDVITGQDGDRRWKATVLAAAIQKEIASDIRKQTDVKVEAVLIPDLTVQ